MRAWSLRRALAAWTLGLLTIVVAALVAAAYLETARLARAEATARAERVAARAAERAAARLRELEGRARLLAERSTLARLLAQGDDAGLALFLERFRTTAELDRVALRAPWGEVETGAPRRLPRDAPAGIAVAAGEPVGAAAAAAPAAVRVEVEDRIEWPPEEAAPLALEIRALAREEIDAAVGGVRIALWRSALERGSASGIDDESGAAIAVRALPGEPAPGLVEAALPERAVLAPARRFAARLGAAALVIGALALALALWLAARLADPVRRLTAAAGALGRGELGQPLPPVGGGEVETLAATLEEMRRGLLAAREELERNRSELEAVLEGASDGVYAVDRDRRVRYLSARAGALLGVEPSAAIGRFCGDLLRPVPDASGEPPCERACPILQARFRGPVRASERLAAGASEWVARLTSSPPAGGMQVQVLRAETADEAARRARDAVVADLAHELKTPLAAQRASLELLRERLDDVEARDLVAGVEAGTLRLSRLIENLLESVRIEAGELAIRRLPVDLEEVVEGAVGVAVPLAARRAQRLEVDLPFPLPAVQGDPQRLEQVLVNLLANAVKFAPEGTEIRLGGSAAAGEVRLWVEDEGPGFDPALLAARAGAGGRFRRGGAPAGVEPREEGSGLGLWIARSICERHGGALAVERVDGRTRVSLRLPASESEP